MVSTPVESSIPYHNLILTGSLGGRAIQTGQMVAARLNCLHLNMDIEIQAREGYGSEDIRKIFGEARVRRLESDMCHEFALRRATVLSVSPTTLLDAENRERLLASGPLLALGCALDETLRRLHVAQGARFHDARNRETILHTLKRDMQLFSLPGLEQLDTTRLSVEQTADRAIAFWRERETVR